MVAPGTALREGIDNIIHSRTGGLILIAEADEISFLFSGGIKLDIDYTPALLYQVAKMDGAIVLDPARREDLLGQRPADARPDDPLDGDRHPAPHRRARLEADQRAGGRDLGAPRRRLALHRGHEVHPPGHPDGPLEGEPGPGDAGEVPRPPRPGLGAAHGSRVRGRLHASRRALGAAARRVGDPDGGRGRALHHRARHRGPPDRDAARGDRGRRHRRPVRAGPRLHRRRLRGEPRAHARRARGPAPPGAARLRSPRRAARLRPQDEHARLRGLAARLPGRCPGSRACRGWWSRRSSTGSAISRRS